MKYKGLRKADEKLLDERIVDGYTVTLKDATTARLNLFQVQKGCRDAIAGVCSYESYVIQNAVKGSGRSQLWIELFNATTHPVET